MAVYQYYPKTMGIEIVRGCNFRCKMCTVTSNINAGRGGGVLSMPLDLFQLIVDKCKKDQIQPEILYFFNLGEPMLHPQFRQLMEIALESKVFEKTNVIMHTNASLLKGEKADAILEVPFLNTVVFSFDGFGDKESFEKLRGEHYDEVLDNIRSFSEKAHLKRPDLALKTATILPREGEVPFLETVSLEQAQKQLQELFSPMGVEVSVRYMHDYSGKDNTDITVKTPPVNGGCSFLEEYSLNILYDGKVMPCCALYDESFSYGSIVDSSPLDLVNSKQLQTIRHHVRMDNRDKLECCKDCTLSIVGYASFSYAQQLWKNKILNGEVQELSEYFYLTNLLFQDKNSDDSYQQEKELLLSRFNQLENQVSELTNQLFEVEKRINEMKKKKRLFFK